MKHLLSAFCFASIILVFCACGSPVEDDRNDRDAHAPQLTNNNTELNEHGTADTSAVSGVSGTQVVQPDEEDPALRAPRIVEVLIRKGTMMITAT